MRNRIARLCVVMALLAAAAGAVVAARADFQTPVAQRSHDLDRRVDRLLVLVANLARAQAAYVTPAQSALSPFEAFPPMLEEVATLTGETGPLLQSSAASRELQKFADGTAVLAQADASAREHLLFGDVLSASHVIFGEASEAANTMTASLGRLREAEAAAAAAAAAERTKRSLTLIGGVAGLWFVGLLLLALLPACTTTPQARSAYPLLAWVGVW
jgi:hypothetical protein